MKNNTMLLDGGKLAIDNLFWFVHDKKIKIGLSERSTASVIRGHRFLSDLINKNKKIIYGVNTGFGPMASYILSPWNLADLQNNLIRSHAAGMGDAIKTELVLAAMVVRLNTLAKGYSGVSPELLKALTRLINSRIIPLVPEHGAVGTSGDLVQLAHIALALIGEGSVFHNGQVGEAGKILKKHGLASYKLKPKEGLALINGTSVMSGIAAILCVHAKNLLDIAIRNGAWGLELVGGFGDGLDATLHSLRPHPGQIQIARRLRALVAGSRAIRERSILDGKANNKKNFVENIADPVQEVYSFRCIPQILGPVADALRKTWNEVEVEINSTTDNPVIDWRHKKILHGGNFHGDYISASVDQLKMTIVKLAMLSERRINFFLNPAANKKFPPFLNINQPGLTLALQGLQFVATSTASQNQTLAFPQYVHSIPTNADNQDIVSMGTDASLLLGKVIDNAYIVLAIELVALAQATDARQTLPTMGKSSKQQYAMVRRIIPKIFHDRSLSPELGRLVETLKNNPAMQDA